MHCGVGWHLRHPRTPKAPAIYSLWRLQHGAAASAGFHHRILFCSAFRICAVTNRRPHSFIVRLYLQDPGCTPQNRPGRSWRSEQNMIA